MTDAEYRAQDDARTLMQAQEIQKDKARMKAAATHLKKMHENARDAMINAPAAARRASSGNGNGKQNAGKQKPGMPTMPMMSGR